ncbi:MAG: DMT family transporter [Candidatus Bathyarchaeia archaeon]|jgi:drug/metabolite transporter (DMT)-like permease
MAALDLGILLAIIAMMSWGVADFLAKIAIDKIGYRTSLVIDQTVNLVPVVIFAILFFRMPSLSIDLTGIIVLVGISGIFGYIFLFRGFQKGDVSVVSPITASWSVVTILLVFFLLGETLMPIQIAGIITVFIGVFFASTNFAELKNSVKQGKSAGVLDAIIAMISWGISYALLRPIVAAVGPIMALLFLKLIATATLFSWTGVTKTRISIPPKMIFLFIASAGILDFLAYTTFNLSLSTQLVSIVSPIAATAPAVTVVLAYVFLKERIVSNQKLGIIAILAGLVLISLA